MATNQYGKVNLYTDGGCIQNPGGSGACGVVIQTSKKVEIFRCNFELPAPCTNNIAEYKALIFGLKACLQFTRGNVRCYTDSKLVAKQMTGRWRFHQRHLADLAGEAIQVMQAFDRVEIKWVPRETSGIRLADWLVNQVYAGNIIILKHGEKVYADGSSENRSANQIAL